MKKQKMEAEAGPDEGAFEKQIGAESLPAATYLSNLSRCFLKNRLAVLGTILMLMIVVLCVGAPLFTPYSPVTDMDLSHMLVKPFSEGHPLGTDDLGRDVWCRLLYGGRNSVLTGLSVALFSACIGIVIGLFGGYFGGFIENILMRFTDIMLSFPLLVVAIAIMAALGSSQRNIIISLAIVGWPKFARLTRGQVLAIKQSEYIESAKTSGFTNMRIIFHHVLPNCMGPLIIQGTLAIGGAILSAASLSYLGLGADAASPDWGLMLSQGRNYIRTATRLTTIPGIAISVTVLAMNWIGDGLRDAFDPKMRK